MTLLSINPMIIGGAAGGLVVLIIIFVLLKKRKKKPEVEASEEEVVVAAPKAKKPSEVIRELTEEEIIELEKKMPILDFKYVSDAYNFFSLRLEVANNPAQLDKIELSSENYGAIKDMAEITGREYRKGAALRIYFDKNPAVKFNGTPLEFKFHYRDTDGNKYRRVFKYGGSEDAVSFENPYLVE